MFLNGELEDEVYTKQPKGFVAHNSKTQVHKLKRDLYRLNQAPKAWYEHTDRYLQGMGFTESELDEILYYLMVGGEVLILVLYVDDLFLTDSMGLIEECKRDLAIEFEKKYL